MKTVAKSALPAGVLESDLKHPAWDSKDRLVPDVGDYGSLVFYETTAFGWCLATLKISNGRRGASTARTYAARVSDGQAVRVGAGPHVKRTVTVYVRTSRIKALQRYIDLYNTSSEQANMIRDRISSRRAQGQVMRAQGRTSWRWDV